MPLAKPLVEKALRYVRPWRLPLGEDRNSYTANISLIWNGWFIYAHSVL